MIKLERNYRSKSTIHTRISNTFLIKKKKKSKAPDIQGVSELDRQTFRADSMNKNKHKTLNTYGVKNA
jgi:hypothetical protein